jgi:C4-dicarboxylate-specific signal transduction histidine kinase
MLGYSREEMIGRPVMEMVAPESREWVMAHIHEGSEQPYEHLALRKDGSVFPVEVQARVIPFKGRSARVSAIRDITEQNKTKAIMENAQRASRLASLGILTGGISHEINQPLTALKVKVDGMLYWEEKDPGSLSKNLVPNLKFISSEAEKIDAIIRHIRSLIRHEKVAAQPVDLNETVRRAMSVLRYQLASHNIHVDLRLGSGPPYAMANETSVSQVLLNLVAYAMNAHDTVDKDHKWIRIVTRSRPSMAILIVADNGPGIPEENRRRIFEPLFTTQAVGTGLGLPIVQFLVQEYEGVIRVRNRPSGGVAFMVMYPASAGRSPEAS